MQATYKKGSEVQMKQDPILAEVNSQICSSGICLAKSRKRVRTPGWGEISQYVNRPQTKNFKIYVSQVSSGKWEFLGDIPLGLVEPGTEHSRLFDTREEALAAAKKLGFEEGKIYSKETGEEVKPSPLQGNPGKLPICSPSQAEALEKCILDVKAKLPARCKLNWSKPPEKQPERCYNAWAVCRSSVGCRLGGSKKYEKS